MSVDLAWMDRALCAEHPEPDIFFATDHRSPTFKQHEAEAKRVCAMCPVTDRCDAYRRETGSVGVWAAVRVPVKMAGPTVRVPLQPHGTSAGYQRHRRRGEAPCTACAGGYAAAKTPGGSSKTQRWS